MRTLSFYGVHGPYGCFSNFSPHGFELDGVYWPTSEHYFQAQKFTGEHAAAIRNAKSPMAAKRMGQSRKHALRSDWERVKEGVMSAALEAKFTAHAELRETLLSTGDARIVEAAPHDAYWGAGPDGRGKNRLGVLLMRLRDRFRDRARTTAD